MATISGWITTILSILSGGQTLIILKLILLVGGGIALWLIKRWINKMLIEEAHKKTQEDRAQQQAGLEQDNRNLFNGAKKDEDSVEDIIKKREDGNK